MRYVVVGSSHNTFFILKALREVDPVGVIYVVERSQEVSRVLASQFNLVPHSGNLLDPSTYEKIDAGKADVFIAATDSDALNIRLIELMKRSFGIPKVIGVVNNPANIDKYRESGADHIINPLAGLETMIKASISSDKWIKSQTSEFFGIDLYINRFVKNTVYGISISVLRDAVRRLNDVLVVVMSRDGEIIRDSSYELSEGDIVLVVAPMGLGEEAVRSIERTIDRLKILRTGVESGGTKL
ncbi:MAG: NAD-binding protein [Sulfolobales archaeon]